MATSAFANSLLSSSSSLAHGVLPSTNNNFLLPSRVSVSNPRSQNPLLSAHFKLKDKTNSSSLITFCSLGAAAANDPKEEQIPIELSMKFSLLNHTPSPSLYVWLYWLLYLWNIILQSILRIPLWWTSTRFVRFYLTGWSFLPGINKIFCVLPLPILGFVSLPNWGAVLDGMTF